MTKKNLSNFSPQSMRKFLKTKHSFSRLNQRHQGFILLEAIICLAILLIILPSAYTFFTQTRKNWVLTQQQEQAILISKNEILKTEAELTQGIKNIDFIPIYDSKFQVTHSMEDVNQHLKKIAIEVSWNSPQGRKKYETSQLMAPLQEKSMPLNEEVK